MAIEGRRKRAKRSRGKGIYEQNRRATVEERRRLVVDYIM